jgi:hypothetical protein
MKTALVIVAILFSSCVSAQVYKGKTLVQDHPCVSGTTTTEVRREERVTYEQWRQAQEIRAANNAAVSELREKESTRPRGIISDNDKKVVSDRMQGEWDKGKERYENPDRLHGEWDKKKPRDPSEAPVVPSCVPNIILPGNVDNCGNVYHPGGARSDGKFCHDIGGGMKQCNHTQNASL